MCMLSLFEAVGRTLGAAFTRDLPIAARLSLPLLKRLLGQRTHWSDLRAVDAQLHRSLLSLVTRRQTAEFWQRLDQRYVLVAISIFSDSVGFRAIMTSCNRASIFSIMMYFEPRFVATESNASGEHVEVPLLSNGAAMVVTEKNKHRYAELLVRRRLFAEGCQEEAAAALVRGFQALVPERHVRILQPDELHRLLAGEECLDVQVWIMMHRVVIKALIGIVEGMNDSDWISR